MKTREMFYKMKTRKMTTHLLDLVNEGMLDERELIRNLLAWMSEDEVVEFAEHIGIDDDEGE
jgi:hypothetical protein